MGDSVPQYVTKKRACEELDMSTDTFDRYMRLGVLPGPKTRGGLTRWKWKEIVDALDGGAVSVVKMDADPFMEGVSRAKAANG